MPVSAPAKITVSDTHLAEARQILARLVIDTSGGHPYPYTSPSTAMYCHAMAEHLLATQVYQDLRGFGDPERTIRRAAYYLAAAEAFADVSHATSAQLIAITTQSIAFACGHGD